MLHCCLPARLCSAVVTAYAHHIPLVFGAEGIRWDNHEENVFVQIPPPFYVLVPVWVGCNNPLGGRRCLEP